MRVGIIGAGIGGLVAAVGLQRAGHEVAVFERAPEPRREGSGLSLFGNAFTALDAVGLGDAMRAVTAPAGLLRAGQRRPDGRWLATTPAASLAALRIAHRSDVHRVLLSALDPDTVRYGSDVLGVPASGDTVTLTTGAESFDVVVAADGIRSRVRSTWPGDPGVRYSGYSTWRGVTATPVDLGGAAGETWGDGLRFGMAPLGDGRVYWFGVASMPPGVALDDEWAAVNRHFAGWHSPIAEMLAATDPATVARLDIHDLAGPLPTFRRGRCVLLGDAAHAMTPDLGQGAGQAMEDAATLAALLAPLSDSDHGGIDAALDRYDALRRPRTQSIARRARSVGAVAQARGRTRVFLRDTAVRLIPASLTARQLTALQSWQPPSPARSRTEGALR
ncbi:FAD-dependent monooxygenase [Spirilliplanes yamanashiensis]|uniref:Monooxygenase n=1 Tax=Spirilliplanes yamanashiensis TaxID=42233 RepID=A0A8J3Y999_9ACTN|nr:FAD-dependent monooxygenase [Spirilliplanes yamanashiensis]MDP9815606.1 2-polyprenyl-6-methoxyphenol hydroxylase-like FAD-dependent oxidoreductase [Spirilliplanes yamanashiensis]GIJ03860.1 monooxygenase [Spirilliplanes yamanashiensis]